MVRSAASGSLTGVCDLVGDFSEINGYRRLGLAALDVATGHLSPWGSEFEPGVDSFTGKRRALRNLSISSIAVYVSGGGDGNRYPQSAPAGRLWGFDAGSGAQLFERTAFVTAIAATSARVYVGGYREPVLWAVDPHTGADVAWSVGLTFRPLGSQEMRVTSLLLDGGRLYLGGYFQTTDNQLLLAAVDAATGQPSTWRTSEPPGFFGEIDGLTRLGPGLVALSGQFFAYDVATGARLPWVPQTHGAIMTVAAAPEGAVLGGRNFNEFAGQARRNLASFDLDTGQLEPWSSALPEAVSLERLDTDGTYLFGATNGAQFFKIDPVSGAVLGTLDFGSTYLVTERVAGGRIVVLAGHSLLGVITIADWSQRSIPLSFEGIGFGSRLVHDLEVRGTRRSSPGGSAPSTARIGPSSRRWISTPARCCRSMLHRTRRSSPPASPTVDCWWPAGSAASAESVGGAWRNWTRSRGARWPGTPTRPAARVWTSAAAARSSWHHRARSAVGAAGGWRPSRGSPGLGCRGGPPWEMRRCLSRVLPSGANPPSCPTA